MKMCTGCKAMKSDSAFSLRSKATGALQSRCKMCASKARKEHYATPRGKKLKIISNAKYEKKTRDWVWEYLDSHPCVDCGESDKIVLEFDHIDRATKVNTIANLCKSSSLKKVMEEVAKCEVRCANCHRRKTAKQVGWFKAQVELDREPTIM